MAQRWRWVQHVAEEFWRRWRSEYVQSLQTRLNWKTNQASPTEGDIVLIKDKQSPNNSWPIAKITSLKLSKDGKVRSVILKLPPLPGKPSRSTTRIHDLVFLYSPKHNVPAPQQSGGVSQPTEKLK